MWMKSFGVAMAVAKIKDHGETEGKVLMAPLEIEYGSGQRRIMQRSLMPSCLRVEESAAKRLSDLTIRVAKSLIQYLQVMNEAVEPIRVAVETMNHLENVSTESSWRMIQMLCIDYIAPATSIRTHLESHKRSRQE
jgi:hypothetical protein